MAIGWQCGMSSTPLVRCMLAADMGRPSCSGRVTENRSGLRQREGWSQWRSLASRQASMVTPRRKHVKLPFPPWLSGSQHTSCRGSSHSAVLDARIRSFIALG
jgi:hypothetical protein